METMDPSEREFLQRMSEKWRKTEHDESRKRVAASLTDFENNLFGNMSTAAISLRQGTHKQDNRNLKDILKIGGDRVGTDQLVKMFYTDVVRNGVQHWSGRQFGMIPNSGHFIYSAAQHIASLGQKMAVNGFNDYDSCDIDKSVLDWVAEIVGFPKESRGVFVSGSSMGVILALCAARDDRLNSCKDYQSSVIYMTDQSHLSNHRAINLVGLKECILRTVPKDKYHRMDPKKLDEMITQDKKNGLTPFLVLSTMGTISLGCVDPLEEIGRVARKHQIWHHVDAAYGGFFLLSDKMKRKHEGLNLSDSFTLDCHKGLSAPFGSGIAMVRNGDLLKQAMARKEAPYIPDVEVRNSYEPLDYSFELTRPFRSFPVWFALQHFGTEAMKDHIEEKLLLTEYAYRKLCDMPDVEVFMKPDLTLIAFRYSPRGPASSGPNTNDVTRKLLEFILADGSVFLTPAKAEGVFYIRICIMSLRSHVEDVDTLLTVIESKLNDLAKSPSIDTKLS